MKIQDEPEILEKCEQHGKELNLFCKEPKCKKAICPRCLTRSHLRHKVVEIEEVENKERKALTIKIDSVKQSLHSKIAALGKAKDDVLKKNETCVKELKKQKEEMVKKLDEMIKNAADHSFKISTDNDEAFQAIDENLVLIETIRENITTGTLNRNAIMNNFETINDIEQSITQSLSGTRTYRYYEYMKNTADVKSLCGKITAQEITFNLSEEGSQDTPQHMSRNRGRPEELNQTRLGAPDRNPGFRAPKEPERRIQSASEFNCRG